MTPLDLVEAISFKTKAATAIDVIPGFGAFFRLDYLTKRRFCAAIFEGDFRDTDSGLSRMLRERRVLKALCTSIDCEREHASFDLDLERDELKKVRTEYHMPSYVISDSFQNFIVVSDSDYYWGFASEPIFMSKVVSIFKSVHQNDKDIKPFLSDSDPHNLRIGKMLQGFHEVCFRSVKAAALPIE